MTISIPHQLPQQEALVRVKNLLGKLKEEQATKISNIKEDWQGNEADFGFAVQGFNLFGRIAVGPASVDIESDLPFALSLFQGKIKQLISEKVAELLQPG